MKKSAFQQCGGKDFKFNFSIDEKMKMVEIEDKQDIEQLPAKIVPSGNSFRFNFNVENNMK